MLQMLPLWQKEMKCYFKKWKHEKKCYIYIYIFFLLYKFYCFFIVNIVQVKVFFNGFSFSLSHACFFFNSVKKHPMMHLMKLANECS